ncbi:MAG TPA: acetyl-CoA hydrolase/transferase C-terminal domain-containing protein [Syntrophomonadaceae bacterium]|nr:acetyl-CoA hydrolase/transferase C-terminal domain-containing protein [Syntrophomonadaceae bacterium]HQA08327.1 acetyl-CoA hydrolase/transferase C-terminal domain-containing protein [Syntrophomonadaceae bacterium]HQE24037.1 acetyl-CoA hydrolase/transferase C-terminal domain-containing protein [Syntrophomonadaceae bacterium]
MRRDYLQMYKDKLCTAAEAVQCIESGDWVDYALFNGKPVACDQALAARKDELEDVKIMTAVTLPPIPEVVMKDPKGEVFTYLDLQFSAASRIMQDKCDGVFYHPVNFGEAENYFSGVWDDPDKYGAVPRKAFIVRTAPMDKNGYFNFGMNNSVTYAQIKSARKVIVEVNTNIPVCLGGAREQVHISEVDYIVESENEPLFALPSVDPTEVDRKIAEHVMYHIRDGCCVQLGIGAMPNLVGKMINETDLKDLGGNTEMLVDAYMDMWESGKMNGRRKNVDDGKIVYTFALGSQELYDWMDNNPALASYNVGYVNHPLRLASIDNLISINQALEVDLYSQVNAESSGIRQISGNGGMSDFVMGAYWSKGGRSLICLPSTYTDKEGKLHSRIVPSFRPGTITTVPRQFVHIIVTEYGWESFKAASTWVRAEKLINLAHPDFRDELIREAEKMKIWRRTNKIE